MINIILMLAIFLHSTIQPQPEIIPLKSILENHPEIVYQPCFDCTPFKYQIFPLSIDPSIHPNRGFFLPTFILTIPSGIVHSQYGWVTIDDQFIQEMIWKNMPWHLNSVQPKNQLALQYVQGKVATISQLAFFNYFHWLTEVLCRLALIELQNIDYDYVFVPQTSKFMKETLHLWGLAEHQIITTIDNNHAIMADQLIVPSLVSSTNLGSVYFTCYVQPQLIEYVKNKLLTAALQNPIPSDFSKRIFISRKDTAIRNITNEDEFFAALEPYGFKRYELTTLSVSQQIQLFHNADIVVSPQGTCLANSIFCHPDVKIIELFQSLNDCTFWYVSQMLHLNYTPIATCEFLYNYTAALSQHSAIPLSVVDEIKQILNL